ncbi:MAG: hypothetical protein ACTSVW_00455 [Candidatus Njordarchaeales archaeon]
MKVVINKCYGGFRLSDKAIDKLKELAKKHKDKKLLKMIEEEEKTKKEYDERIRIKYGIDPSKSKIWGGKYWGLTDIDRTHPLLIKVVEELGEEASTPVSKLKIVEIPDNIEWEIEEYDGIEWIAEKHRTWG